MSNDQSKVVETISPEVRDVGKGQIIVAKPLFEFRQLKKPEGGRPSMFENPRIMALLESAYKIGATHEEAALHAGLPSQHSLMYHIKAETELSIFYNNEDTGDKVKFNDLIALWRGNLTLAAKNAIYSSIAAKNTQDSWRVLERHQRNEWGLKAGQGSVDGNSPLLDLGEEAAARVAKYVRDPNAESKNLPDQTLEKSQTASLVDTSGGTPVIEQLKP